MTLIGTPMLTDSMSCTYGLPVIAISAGNLYLYFLHQMRCDDANQFVTNPDMRMDYTFIILVCPRRFKTVSTMNKLVIPIPIANLYKYWCIAKENYTYLDRYGNLHIIWSTAGVDSSLSTPVSLQHFQKMRQAKIFPIASYVHFPRRR